ncbi:MAG: hypothetical protein ABIL37_01955 [candidate division WOR-3 bacterium]
MSFVGPFTYIYSIFISEFKIFLGSEIGILVLDQNSLKVYHQFLTNSRVEFIAYKSNWIYYFSNNGIYKIFINWHFDREPFLIKSNVPKPKKFGISEDYKIILDYGDYKKVYNDAGFEDNNYYGNIYWSSFDTLNFPQNYIWNYKLGNVKLNFSYEYNDYNYIGTQGLGLLIYYKGSLSIKDSVILGTFNRNYKSFTLRDNKLYILGDKGIDVLNNDFQQENFIKIDICSQDAKILKDLVFCKNNIYKIEDNDVKAIMKAIDFEKVRYIHNKYYILAFDGVFEFDGFNLEKIYNERVFDVYLKNDSIEFIKSPLVSDQFVKVTNVDNKNFLCFRFGIMQLNDSSKVFNFHVGNVNDCLYHKGFIFIATDNGILKFSLKNNDFQYIINLNGIRELLIFQDKLLALTKNLIYILPVNF